jgi:hypothetical protein
MQAWPNGSVRASFASFWYSAMPNKRLVQVYDYVDIRAAMLARMFDKRMRGYKTIGYVVEASENV